MTVVAKITTCERCKETLIGHPESPRRPVPVTYGDTDILICYECAVELTLLIGNWIDTTPVKAQREHSEKIKEYWRERMESERRHLDRWDIPYTYGEHDDGGGFTITRYDSPSDVPLCRVEGCTRRAKHELDGGATGYLCAEHFEIADSLPFAGEHNQADEYDEDDDWLLDYGEDE